MGTKYSSQTQSGYNASPPPDDGSTGANNLGTWAGVKTKIGDPVLTLAQNINTALTNALDFSSRTTAINDTATGADHMKTIECTAGAITVKVPTSASIGAGFIVNYKNTSAGNVTVGLVTATDTLDGVVNGTFVLLPQQSLTVKSNLAGTGYYSIAGFFGAAGGGAINCTTLTASSTISASGTISGSNGLSITAGGATIAGSVSAGGQVTGQTLNGSGASAAIYGNSTGGGGDGVYGNTATYRGVVGNATSSGIGVAGFSSSGWGTYGLSISGSAIYGTSTTGPTLTLVPQAAAPTTGLSNGSISIGATAGTINVYFGGAWYHIPAGSTLPGWAA